MMQRTARVALRIDVVADERGYVATCREIPGVSFRAATHDGALAAAGEGFRQLIEAVTGELTISAAEISRPGSN